MWKTASANLFVVIGMLTIALTALPALAKDQGKSLKDLVCVADEIVRFNGTDWECSTDDIGGGGGGMTGYEVIQESCLSTGSSSSSSCDLDTCTAFCSPGKVILGRQGFVVFAGSAFSSTPVMLFDPPSAVRNSLCADIPAIFIVTAICADGELDCEDDGVCNEACAPSDDPDC